MIWIISLCLWQTVERIAPPGTGYHCWRSADCSVFVGQHYVFDADGQWLEQRIYFWTANTGIVWLDEVLPLPGRQQYRDMVVTDTDYRLILVCGDLELLATLPLDPRDWLTDADLDHDGDVDQEDFGLWQRRPGLMHLHRFLAQMRVR